LIRTNMKFRYFLLPALLIALFVVDVPAASLSVGGEVIVLEEGPGDKEKKKKDKDDKEAKSKISKKKYSPAKKARLSAKNARRASKLKKKEITARAKTRNFFHRTFNTKYGKPVNFRKRRQRNRWKRGR